MRYSRQEEAQLAAKWEEGRGGGCRWKCLCEKANNEIGITRMYTNTNQVLKRWDRQRQKQEGERRKLPFLFHWLAFRTSFCNAKSERISAKGSSLPSCRPLTTEKMFSLSYSFLLQKKSLGLKLGWMKILPLQLELQLRPNLKVLLLARLWPSIYHPYI